MDKIHNYNKNIITNSTLIAKNGNIHNGDIILDTRFLCSFSKNTCSSPLYYIDRTFSKKQKLIFGESLGNLFDLENIENTLDQYPQLAILGEAGFGKSIELQKIGFNAQQLENWQISYYKLKEIKNSSTGFPFLRIPSNNQAKMLLILDGLDEVNIEDASNKINILKAENPNLNIITSCRTNIYSNTLDGFDSFYIHKFSNYAISAYLNQRLGDRSDHFWQLIPNRELKKLMQVPFFLEKAVAYYQKYSTLPNTKVELIEHFIKESLLVRIKEIDRSQDLSKVRNQCLKFLEKLAFVMECLGKNSLPIKDFGDIFDESKEIELVLKKSSLIHLNDEQFIFAHRIIQEFLTAKILAKSKSLKNLQRIIAVPPTYKKVKFSWINTISDLVQLLPEKKSHSKSLLDWLFEENNEILVYLEKHKIPSEFRLQVVSKIFNNHKATKTKIGNSRLNPWDLAIFGESYSFFKFLFKELKEATTLIAKHNSLSILNNFTEDNLPIEKKKEFRSLLVENIFDFDFNSAYERYLALEVLIRFFEKFEPVEVEKLFNTFFESKEYYERLGVYHFISHTKSHAFFMEALLSRAKEMIDEKHTIDFDDEETNFYDCLSNIESREGILAFFKIFPKIFTKEWSDIKGDVVPDLLKKAIALSLNNQDSLAIFESMKHKFPRLSPLTYTHKSIIQEFLEKYNLSSKMVDYCLGHYNYCNLIAYYYEEDCTDLIVQKFHKGELTRDWISNFIRRLKEKNKNLANLFLLEINKYSKTPLTSPDFRKYDAEKEKAKILKRDKLLFFDKEVFLKEIEKIYVDAGKERFKKIELDEFTNNKAAELNYFNHYPNFIKNIIRRYKKTKSELIKCITENWLWVQVSELKKFITKNKLEKKFFSVKERAIVEKWCDSYVNTFQAQDSLTNGANVFIFFTIFFSFSKYEEQIYLSMIGKGFHTGLGYQYNLLTYLSETINIPNNKITEKVLSSLRKKQFKNFELWQFLKYLDKNPSVKARPILQNLIIDDKEVYHRRLAMYAYLSCKGNKEFLYKLFPRIDSTDDFIYDIANFLIKEKTDSSEQLLLDRFSLLIDQDQKLRFARYLLYLGNLKGLEFLVEYTKVHHNSPFDSMSMRHSIPFENINGITLLLDFYHLSIDDNLKNDSFRSLSSIVSSMIWHLSLHERGKYYSIIQKEIIRRTKIVKKPLNCSQASFDNKSNKFRKALSNLSTNLEIEHQKYQDMNISTALEYFKELTN